jgi:hypothetical protein
MPVSFAPVGEGDVKDEGEAPAIDVSGSQGVQAGPGNVQYNTWASKPPPDLASLRALNPHVAVARLQRLSHDDVVDLFARASGDDATDVLAAFLETDAATVVAILGDISRRKATELIKPLVRTSNWLATLPEAAEAIARKGVALKWVHTGVLERLISAYGPGYSGYSRGYRNGRLFWHDKHGVGAVSGPIETRRADNDWIGLPVGDQETAPSSPFGTDGVRQVFSNWTVYASKHGAFPIFSLKCFGEEGGSAGWLGFPVAETQKSGIRLIQRFEGGTIYASLAPNSKTYKAYAIRREVIEALSGWTVRPVSKETTTKSSYGASGTVQRFEVRQNDQWQETAVFSSADHGIIIVAPEIWNYYDELGGEGSRLGFPSPAPERWHELTTVPVSPRPAVPPAVRPAVGHRHRTARQFFEGGFIYWRIEIGAFAVTGPVFETIAPDPALREELGWPVSEERPIGPGESDQIQFFDNGNVTFRDGKGEIWLRPETRKP